MKKYLTTLLLGISISANAQVFVVMGTDSVLISKQKGRKIEHFNN